MEDIKILLVEDEANLLKLTSLMLEKAGFKVIQAENGAKGVEVALKENPDIVITDLIMPEKNGFELCKELRKSETMSKVPIIVLTAMGDEFNKITAFDAGADDYLTKPFNMDELKARIQSLLRRTKSS
ncbi:MAG: response regulator transcription factor [Candidatus Margulisbacteria bacterium]|nr:response regulator transcription factor [Candidatus Margulisiibacteriota bacterium]